MCINESLMHVGPLKCGKDKAGGSPAAGHFPCAAKESNQRKAAPVSRPVFSGCPCAACLDVATAQLDLAGHT
jgi:hypothetical protein